MPPVGVELTISVLERAKTVRALDRAATAIGCNCLNRKNEVVAHFDNNTLHMRGVLSAVRNACSCKTNPVS
jgi:hypothetical protein